MAKTRTKSENIAEPVESASQYSVIARRYRPQQFADLIGQEATAQAMVNALKGNRVAHAYLFTGIRGTGKTSAARILAKALNCVKGPTPTPCDECESCKAIAVGEDVDVQEIDGASNRNLDDIRELRSNVQYRPSRSRFKIYIIDEVHQLTKESFNALLKTLEEPPPHVKFIFATTDVQKVPVTILSRCQRFDFIGIGTPGIVRRLKEIIAAEGREAEDEAVELIAHRAGGSMRDAQSLLDQLLAFGNEKLTCDQIHRLLGTAHEDQVAALAEAVLAKEMTRALTLLDEAVAGGIQLGELIDQLVEYWRDLMLLKSAGSEYGGFAFPPRFRDAMRARADQLSLPTVLAALDILSATKGRLRYSSHARILVEMALVRLGQLEELLLLSQVVELLSGKPGEPPRASAPGPSRVGSAPSAPVKKNSLAPDNGVPVDPAVSQTPFGAAELTGIWERLLAAAGPMFGADLARGTLAISGPNSLVVRFPARYNKEKDRCQDPSKIEKVEEILAKITGQRIIARMETGESESEPAAATEQKMPRSKAVRDAAMRIPLVSRAVSELDAQLIPSHTDEDFGTAFAANNNSKTESEG